MKYCVYLKHPESKIEQVLEYFATQAEAEAFAKAVKHEPNVQVHVGEFIAHD